MLRCAEFCAGIGGFRIGLEESELDVKFVYTNEINDQCEINCTPESGQFF